MNTRSSTPDLMPRDLGISSFAARTFAPHPSFQGVIAQLFKEQWLEKYPSRDVHVGQLKLVEPIPYPDLFETESASLSPRFRYMPVVDVMIQGYIDAQPVRLIQGVHYLVADDDVEDLYLLSVDMAQVQVMINDCAALLIETYQHALARYWSENSASNISPVEWLKRALQAGVSSFVPNSARGSALSNEQAAALAAVVSFPDKAERLQASAETPLHAYLVAVESTPNNLSGFVQLPGMMLVTRQMTDRLLILSYSQDKGVELHDTLQSFGASLSQYVQGVSAGGVFDWSLYEPEGHFFTALALSLLDKKLQDIGATGPRAQAERWSVERLVLTLDDACSVFPFFSPAQRLYYDHIMSRLPLWLKQASALDLLAYSKLMIKQVIWHSRTKGQTFLEGIVALPVFAEQLLAARIKAQYPQSAVDVTQITVQEVIIENIALGQVAQTAMPLTEFALAYIGGKPSALMNVADRESEVLPGWLSVDYVKNLVDELDIGTRYIELLKQKLIEDTTESTGRLALYKTQMSIQLPMLALEKKIKGECGFTEAGWRMLQRMLRPDAQLSTGNSHLCVRPLGFYAYEGASVDFVSTMFVFGSSTIESGPFILYMPFVSEPLQEFPTWTALMAAIKQPGELQTQVLAWLDDAARSYYIDGGFERPHLEGVLLEGFLRLLPRSPAMLSNLHLEGDYLEAMFKDHAAALVTLTDRHTVSTSERRWNLLKQCGWTVFNGLTFFITGPWQQAAWIFQTLMSLKSGLLELQQSDKEAFTQTVIDVLFNISQALLHAHLNLNARANDQRLLKAPVDEPMFSIFDDQVPTPVEPPRVKALIAQKLPESDPGAAQQHSALDFAWFSPAQVLTQRQRASLDTFAVDIDLSRGQKIAIGPLQGLITFQDKTYVQLDGKAYRVTRLVEGLVIQDAQDPQRFGPSLRSDQPAQWHLDLRLGLRGGSPQKRLEQARDEKVKMLDDIMVRAVQFKLQAVRLEVPLTVTENLLDSGGELRPDFITRYEADLEPWATSVREKLGLLAKLDEELSVQGVSQQMQDGWAQLGRRYFKLHDYLEKQLKTLPLGGSSTTYFAARTKALDAVKVGDNATYLQWIEDIKLNETLEKRLFKQADNQLEVLNKLRKESMPRDSEILRLLRLPMRDLFTRNWVVRYLETLSELVLRKDSPGVTVEEQHAFKVISDISLVDTAWSQISLRREGESYAPEHFSLLESAIKTYRKVESICLNLQTLQSENFRNEYLAGLGEVVTYLRKFAEVQLAMVIRDSESSSSELDEPRPGPSRLMKPVRSKVAAGKSRQKFFKTTDNTTLVGTIREPVAGATDEIVDVGEEAQGGRRQPLTSYRRLERGEWVTISATKTPQPIPVLISQSKNLSRLMIDGRALLARVDGAILENRARAVASKIPIELEEIMEFKARSLEDIAQKIDQVVATDSAEFTALEQEDKTATPTLSHELKASALRLRAEGRALRISLIKKLPPTGTGVEYLKAQGEVSIAAEGPRQHLFKGPRKDYLQEFSIKDRDGSPLWFAHVHYKAQGSAVNDFEVAHLKFADQRFLSEKALYAKARNPDDYIAVYRANMDRDLVNRVFFAVLKDVQPRESP